MNEFFIIKESQFERYDFFVYSTMGENVLDYLEEVEREISNFLKTDKKSKILFDTLLYASNTPDRFIHADYKDNTFVADSFEFVNVPKKDIIRKLSLQFFISHKDFIEQSGVLNSTQKKILFKGIPI
ncbi:type II toxin-antitoxin system RnlB family antitoxin [Lactococcus lactis]|uniref:type II toxin-antitoxin system RnlB family antitoxin n=1 Tax=Lactococcus lactis TaxID=1358 RepID=UPI0025A005F9|nr:type II toxin-antitoxin system RnlB family antitoxin [Lactococcus lactis]MDM7535542.1 type II toxin-antitoxin system RnlB family antitoxin [Lactococcus lactis]WKG36262.1 type II toxin-antitoxin system RnlB family antitoxin [Lactococcus lactis subsp. lactis]